MNFKLWIESSLDDLYQSAVQTYPRTKYRQHAVDPIKITGLSIVPFKGLNTIFFKGLANNEGRHYNPKILFKKAKFSEDGMAVMATDGNVHYVKPLSLTENEVVVRCECGDFFHRWNYADYLDKSLYGRKRKKYESLGGTSVNPTNSKGLCKHLIALTRSLRDSGILKE